MISSLISRLASLRKNVRFPNLFFIDFTADYFYKAQYYPFLWPAAINGSGVAVTILALTLTRICTTSFEAGNKYRVLRSWANPTFETV